MCIHDNSAFHYNCFIFSLLFRSNFDEYPHAQSCMMPKLNDSSKTQTQHLFYHFSCSLCLTPWNLADRHHKIRDIVLACVHFHTKCLCVLPLLQIAKFDIFGHCVNFTLNSRLAFRIFCSRFWAKFNFPVFLVAKVCLPSVITNSQKCDRTRCFGKCGPNGPKFAYLCVSRAQICVYLRISRVKLLRHWPAFASCVQIGVSLCASHDWWMGRHPVIG